MVNQERASTIPSPLNPELARQLPVLWHFRVSPYNEKARWALDYKSVPHIRRTAQLGQHAKIAKRLAGTTTFPVLELNGEAFGDSTMIIDALERYQPDPPLYPGDPEDRRRALEIEDYFDEEFGHHLRRASLHRAFPEPALFFDVFAQELTGVRRSAARLLYPLVRRRVAKHYSVNGQSVQVAMEKLHKAGERFANELGPGGYLVGDEFTVADLSVASLFAPAVAPEQFPYPQPQRHHPRFDDLRELLGRYGAVDWTRDIYARHRPRSFDVLAEV
jgi:glutathione S-transferase